MCGQDLLEQGRSGTRQADDEHHFAPELRVERRRQEFGGVQRFADEAFERSQAPARTAARKRVRCGNGGKRFRIAAAVFLGLAQCMAHGDAVSLYRRRIVQQLREHRDVAVVQRPRLDVRQAAPRVAADRMQRQRGAIARLRLVEAAQMRQRVAEQDRRRQQFGREGTGPLERFDRLDRAALLLQVAAEVEPRHRLLRVERGGAPPAGKRGVGVAQRAADRAEVVVQHRVIGADRQRAFQRRQCQIRTAAAQLQDRPQPQRFGMFRRGGEHPLQRLCGPRGVAVADRACSRVQGVDQRGRQLGCAWFALRRSGSAHARLMGMHLWGMRSSGAGLAFAEAGAQRDEIGGEDHGQREQDFRQRVAAFRRPAPGHHHPMREPRQRQHARPEGRRARPDAQQQRQRQRRQHEHRQRRRAGVAIPGGVQRGQGQQRAGEREARAHADSFTAIAASRRPSARASCASSSASRGSFCEPATWLAP
jgi:hypothetical protein